MSVGRLAAARARTCARRARSIARGGLGVDAVEVAARASPRPSRDAHEREVAVRRRRARRSVSVKRAGRRAPRRARRCIASASARRPSSASGIGTSSSIASTRRDSWRVARARGRVAEPLQRSRATSAGVRTRRRARRGRRESSRRSTCTRPPCELGACATRAALGAYSAPHVRGERDRAAARIGVGEPARRRGRRRARGASSQVARAPPRAARVGSASAAASQPRAACVVRSAWRSIAGRSKIA